MGVGFVKRVGFKPGVKKRGSYGWAKWWIKRRRSDERRSKWVGNYHIFVYFVVDTSNSSNKDKKVKIHKASQQTVVVVVVVVVAHTD